MRPRVTLCAALVASAASTARVASAEELVTISANLVPCVAEREVTVRELQKPRGESFARITDCAGSVQIPRGVWVVVDAAAPGYRVISRPVRATGPVSLELTLVPLDVPIVWQPEHRVPASERTAKRWPWLVLTASAVAGLAAASVALQAEPGPARDASVPLLATASLSAGGAGAFGLIFDF